MYRVMAFLGVLLVLTVLSDGQGRSSDLSFVYGVWKIQRLQECAGHASGSVPLARKQIGREIEFRLKSMSYEKGILFLGASCKRATYRIKKQKLGRYDVGEKGTLEFCDLDPKRPGWIEDVIVKCNDGADYHFERAKGNSLAIYTDGWFFFLEKVSN